MSASLLLYQLLEPKIHPLQKHGNEATISWPKLVQQARGQGPFRREEFLLLLKPANGRRLQVLSRCRQMGDSDRGEQFIRRQLRQQIALEGLVLRQGDPRGGRVSLCQNEGGRQARRRQFQIPELLGGDNLGN